MMLLYSSINLVFSGATLWIVTCGLLSRKEVASFAVGLDVSVQNCMFCRKTKILPSVVHLMAL